MTRILRVSLMLVGVIALSGCAVTQSLSSAARTTGQAALRAAGVESQATASVDPETAESDVHWSEDWVWEGDTL